MRGGGGVRFDSCEAIEHSGEKDIRSTSCAVLFGAAHTWTTEGGAVHNPKRASSRDVCYERIEWNRSQKAQAETPESLVHSCFARVIWGIIIEETDGEDDGGGGCSGNVLFATV